MVTIKENKKLGYNGTSFTGHAVIMGWNDFAGPDHRDGKTGYGTGLSQDGQRNAGKDVRPRSKKFPWKKPGENILSSLSYLKEERAEPESLQKTAFNSQGIPERNTEQLVSKKCFQFFQGCGYMRIDPGSIDNVLGFLLGIYQFILVAEDLIQNIAIENE